MVTSLTAWHSACAAVVGRAHEAKGDPCQDSVGALTTSKASAIALADGAGSAKHGGLGARVAVKSVLDLVTGRFEELVAAGEGLTKGTIVDEVRHRLHEEAGASGAQTQDLATTLLFVCIQGDQYLAGHIGDGVIAHMRDGHVAVLSHPQRGEHANETIFVTSGGAEQRMMLSRGSSTGMNAFALMSDGTQSSLYDARARRMGPALQSVWEWLDSNAPAVVEVALAKNIRELFRAQTTDDCSLGLLRRVTISASRLPSFPLDFQRELLRCKTSRSLATRLRVLQAMEDGESLPALAERIHVKVPTLRKHAQAVKRMLVA